MELPSSDSGLMPIYWSLIRLFEVFHFSTNDSSAYSFQPYMNLSLRGILMNTMFSNTWVLQWCFDVSVDVSVLSYNLVLNLLLLRGEEMSPHTPYVKVGTIFGRSRRGRSWTGRREDPGMMWNHLRSLDTPESRLGLSV